MRKASNIILLVGAIISIVTALIFLIMGIVFTLAGQLPTEEVIKGLSDGTYTTTISGTPEEQALAIKAVSTGLGVFFLLATVFNIVNTVLAFVARSKKSTGLYVANIVFGVLSMTEVTIVGGIFGLVANSTEKNNPVVE